MNLRPGLGAAALHEAKIIGILPLHDGIIKARPRLAAAIPVCDPMSLSDHAQDIEMFEPGEVRREGDVRQGVIVAGEPLVRGKRLFHLVEEQDHAFDRNDEVLERIYIGRHFKNDTERLEKLFDMYIKMTVKQTVSVERRKRAAK